MDPPAQALQDLKPEPVPVPAGAGRPVVVAVAHDPQQEPALVLGVHHAQVHPEGAGAHPGDCLVAQSLHLLGHVKLQGRGEVAADLAVQQVLRPPLCVPQILVEAVNALRPGGLQPDVVVPDGADQDHPLPGPCDGDV